MGQRQQAQKFAEKLHSANDYLAYLATDGFHRWPISQLPLKVYIAPADHVKGYRAEFNDELIESFQEWSQATYGVVAFRFVDKRQEANITCEFVDDPRRLSSPAEGGEAKVSTSSKQIEKAGIVFLTIEAGKQVTDNRMRAIELHEIGHSLGLIGHSDNIQDIMYFCVPSDTYRPRLSSRDASTLTRLYTDGSILAAKLQDADLVQEPANDPVFELNKKASSLYSSGEFDNAESVCREMIALLESQSSGPDERLVTTLRNYARVLKRLGREGDARQAEDRADKLARRIAQR